MNWLNNLKVGKKLVLLVIFALIGMFAVSGAGFYSLIHSNTNMKKMYQEKLLGIEYLDNARVDAHQVKESLFRLMIETDPSTKKDIQKEITADADDFNENLDKYKAIPKSAKENEIIADMSEQLQKYRDGREQVIKLASQNQNTEAYATFNASVKPYADAFLTDLVTLSKSSNADASSMYAENSANVRTTTTAFFLISGLATLIVVVLGILIGKRIVKRLNDFVVFMSLMADGEFSKPVSKANMEDKSEFGQVSISVERTRANMKQFLSELSELIENLVLYAGQLMQSSEQSADASNMIASSIATMSDGASDQSQMSQNTNESVHDISNRIGTVSKNAKSVSELTTNAKTSVSKGEDAIEQAIRQMQVVEEKTTETAMIISELDKKSVKIGQIIDSINSISKQTNLLALNAAIESARAGEAGKGFSVVADEIRKLAEESQKATNEIANIVQEVQQSTGHAVAVMTQNSSEVSTGASVVETAGSSFHEIYAMINEISSQIENVSNHIVEINDSTLESSSLVEKINDISLSMSEESQSISAATEEQLSSMEEIASSCNELSQMAENLKGLMGKFKFEEK